METMNYKQEFQDILNHIEIAKHRLAEVTEGLYSQDRDVDSLDEALEVLDDAIDIISEYLEVDE